MSSGNAVSRLTYLFDRQESNLSCNSLREIIINIQTCWKFFIAAPFSENSEQAFSGKLLLQNSFRTYQDKLCYHKREIVFVLQSLQQNSCPCKHPVIRTHYRKERKCVHRILSIYFYCCFFSTLNFPFIGFVLLLHDEGETDRLINCWKRL